MTVEMKNYIQTLAEKSIDKDNVVMNIGLLLEKNNSKNNPTDYSLLLPQYLVNLSLSQKDIDEIVNSLLILLKNEPVYSSRIVWSIGKTFDEKKIEDMLSIISQMKYCDEETFKQINFLADVVKNERINQLVDEINLLRKTNIQEFKEG